MSEVVEGVGSKFKIGIVARSEMMGLPCLDLSASKIQSANFWVSL